MSERQILMNTFSLVGKNKEHSAKHTPHVGRSSSGTYLQEAM